VLDEIVRNSSSSARINYAALRQSLKAKLELRAAQARGEVLSTSELLRQEAEQRAAEQRREDNTSSAAVQKSALSSSSASASSSSSSRVVAETLQEKIAELTRLQQTCPLSPAEMTSNSARKDTDLRSIEVYRADMYQSAIQALRRISGRRGTEEEDRLFKEAADRYEATAKEFADILCTTSADASYFSAGNEALHPTTIYSKSRFRAHQSKYETAALEHIGFLIQHANSLPKGSKEAENYQRLVELQKEHLRLREELKNKFANYGIDFIHTVFNRYYDGGNQLIEIDAIDSFMEAFEEYTALNNSLRCAREALEHIYDVNQLQEPINITRVIPISVIGPGATVSFFDAIKRQLRSEVLSDLCKQKIDAHPEGDNNDAHLLIASLDYSAAASLHREARVLVTEGNSPRMRIRGQGIASENLLEFFNTQAQRFSDDAKAAESKVNYSGIGLK
jgi:hypothetical protein